MNLRFLSLTGLLGMAIFLSTTSHAVEVKQYPISNTDVGQSQLCGIAG
ncbi:MAG: hypothetical protein ACREO1_16230 [Arenimonas sp.]